MRYTDPTGLCPECEKKVKDPKERQVYESTGGGTYTYSGGDWSKNGGALAEVTVRPSGNNNVASTFGG